jgi:hypothetical protein
LRRRLDRVVTLNATKPLDYNTSSLFEFHPVLFPLPLVDPMIYISLLTREVADDEDFSLEILTKDTGQRYVF